MGDPLPRHSRYILRPPPMSTRPAKERAGLALVFPLVEGLVGEGLHPAIRRPTTMRRPNLLMQRSANTRFSGSCSGVGAPNGFLLFMNTTVLFLSSTGVKRAFTSRLFIRRYDRHRNNTSLRSIRCEWNTEPFSTHTPVVITLLRQPSISFHS